MQKKQAKFISLFEASEKCEYSQEYLSLRARQGKLKSKKIGRNWYTTESWLHEYLKNYSGSKIVHNVQNDFKININKNSIDKNINRDLEDLRGLLKKYEKSELKYKYAKKIFSYFSKIILDFADFFARLLSGMFIAVFVFLNAAYKEIFNAAKVAANFFKLILISIFEIVGRFKKLTAGILTVLKFKNLNLISEEKLVFHVIKLHRLFNALKDIPFIKKVWPSEANFLLMETDCSQKVMGACAKQGIILRSMFDKIDLNNAIRITVGLPEENNQLIQVLQQVQ